MAPAVVGINVDELPYLLLSHANQTKHPTHSQTVTSLGQSSKPHSPIPLAASSETFPTNSTFTFCGPKITAGLRQFLSWGTITSGGDRKNYFEKLHRGRRDDGETSDGLLEPPRETWDDTHVGFSLGRTSVWIAARETLCNRSERALLSPTSTLHPAFTPYMHNTHEATSRVHGPTNRIPV